MRERTPSGPAGASGVVVREERVADRAAVATTVAAAFRSKLEADLVDAIRASAGFVPAMSLVAEAGGAVVGHVLVSHVDLVDGRSRHQVASLSPLAVHPDHQGRGIGSALVRAVVDRADGLGEPVVVLEGSPAYYGRFGFRPAAELGIEIDLPSWAVPEAAQALPLHAYRPTIKGRVVYPPAFDAVTDGH